MADKIAKRGVSIFIDGKEVKNSVVSITSEMKRLEAQQKKMTIGADDYVAHGQKIERLKSILAEHKQNQRLIAQEYTKMTKGVDEYGKKHESVFSRAANWFNKYAAMGVGFIGMLTGVSLTFRKLAEDVAKMDDVYSDVMKTTGMTKDEVAALNEELKKMDTRTSREELNKIAEAGGRIGVAKKDILSFVGAMDIANVALGDSFVGGVEEISTKLGKLRSLFAETKDMEIEKAYLSIASAINELGANGAASEPNIAEFTTRIGSMQEALKPSIADTLALAAAFEESGIEAEVSSRAYGIILNRATTDTGNFAKVMGKTTQEVENLINSNPLEFFLQFAESMRGMSATDTGKTLDLLKINADGANKAVGAASNNIDRFRELLEMSNKSFAEGTSVVNEYNIKNNNLAAQLDKAKKAFNETALELGSRLNPILLKSVSGTTYLIKALVSLPNWLRQNRGEIITITAVMAAYTVAVNANRIAMTYRMAVEKAKIILERISTASSLAAAAAQALFTGNIERAAKAMRVLNSVIRVNPYVALGVAISTVVLGVYKLATRTTDAQKAIQEFNREAHAQTTELNNIFNAYKKANPQSAEKARLLAIIKEKYGPYIKDLINEKGQIIDIEKAQRQANEAIRQNIALKIQQASVDEISKKETKKQADILTDIEKFVTKKKGSDIAGVVVAEIGRIFSENSTDLKKAYSQGWDLLSKYGISPLSKKGSFSGSLADDLRGLWNSFSRLNNQSNAIKRVFKGLIGDIKVVEDAANGGNGSGDTDGTKGGGGFSPSGDSEKFDPDKFREENRRIAKELADAAISDLEETLQFAEYVQREQLAGHKQTLEEEHALKLKSLENDRQLELDKAEISATSAVDAEKAKKLIRQKYQTLTAEENAAFAEKQADIDKKRQEKYLSDKLAGAAQDSEEAFELEKQMREMQMAEELALVEKGSQEEKAIRDKYRKMEEDAEANLLHKKQQMVLEYANMGMNIANGLNSFLTELDNAELANFEANNKDKANYDEEYAKKKAKLEYDAAVRAKAIGALQVIVNTAGAIMAALAIPFGAGIPLAIANGIEGALQLATVLAAPLPQLWTGGFTGSGGKYEPKGVVHGNEFVANSDALNNPNLLPMFQAIDTAQRMGTVRNMKPDDLRLALRQDRGNSETTPAGNTSSSFSEKIYNYQGNRLDKIEKTIDKLNTILENGIEANSVISGRNGSYEQTRRYNRYVKNASR